MVRLFLFFLFGQTSSKMEEIEKEKNKDLLEDFTTTDNRDVLEPELLEKTSDPYLVIFDGVMIKKMRLGCQEYINGR